MNFEIFRETPDIAQKGLSAKDICPVPWDAIKNYKLKIKNECCLV